MYFFKKKRLYRMKTTLCSDVEHKIGFKARHLYLISQKGFYSGLRNSNSNSMSSESLSNGSKVKFPESTVMPADGPGFCP